MISAFALDLGTTSIKAGSLDRQGALTHIVTHPAPKITGDGGRYESDALAYAAVAEQALSECMAREFSGGASEHIPLGMCSQRSSFLLWERGSGSPVTPLISWQDNRGAASCEALRQKEGLIRDLTGLPLTQYYFAPKLGTLLQDNPDWLARLKSGELLAGTLDTFLIWRWTGGKYFVTDASMAARTQLMDIHKLGWSPQLCGFFGIPPEILPEIRPSAGLNLMLDNGLVLQAGVGDQSAAFFASVSRDHEALVNLGTGCFVSCPLPDGYLSTERSALDGYLHTLVYQDRTQHAHFAIEGTLNSIAAALAPYPADECLIGDVTLGDVFCVAEPSGLGAPYFRNDVGIHFSQQVEHLAPHQIASLMLEAVIFRVARILENFQQMFPLERVYLSGGLSELPCLKHGIANCVPFAVYHLGQAEASLRGAALLAAGMEPAHNRESERVEDIVNDGVLQEKFRRWKIWLDDLLEPKQ